ncbi:putative Pentatricopeptide repeat-containing protein [Zostera marina]|uniref:Putative Pentatricopeptide repeat-containing protein n=1 Tax=Zostera marina TaxID=29655 RepID=A0A0K9PGY6_ZOSMR|nr:putative Pentatricopeptide repeat-containing protein [Zostera marina]
MLTFSISPTPILPVLEMRLLRLAAAITNTTTIFSTRSLSLVSHNGGDSESKAIRKKNMALTDLIRNGRLREARKLFDGMDQRSIVTWNSMISGHVRQGELMNARNLFDVIPERDIVTWNSMLLGYTMSKNTVEFEEGRKLFERMPSKDTVSWNTMLRGYMRNRRIDDAVVLFDRMPKRNSVSWNTMITGFLDNGEVSKAIMIFETMPVSDHVSMSALVSGLIRNGRLKDAETLLAKRCKHNITEGLLDACNTLIAGYGRLGKVEEALRLFDLIPNRDRSVDNRERSTVSKNVVTWNSMIMCYLKVGDLCSARNLFDEMPYRDIVSWNTMVFGYMQALNVEEAESLFRKMPCPDGFTWNSMVSGFSQKGDLHQAKIYFDEMPCNCKTVISWNTLIAAYDQNGDHEGAINVFYDMLSSGEKPDQHTVSSAISACASLASLNTGLQIHQLIVKTLVQDLPTSNSLITMYARCGSFTDARSIFDSMTLRKDFITWNSMIGGYAQHGLTMEALRLFEKMKASEVKPTNITFISILNACYNAGLVTEGQKQFDSMVEEHGIVPGVEHYALLVSLVGRSGQLQAAMNIINNMLIVPDKTVWGALLDACKIHGDWKLARVAANAVMELEPDSAGPHVLLYNMYADEGRWEDAMKVRKALDGSGIKKQLGCSWIPRVGSD